MTDAADDELYELMQRFAMHAGNLQNKAWPLDIEELRLALPEIQEVVGNLDQCVSELEDHLIGLEIESGSEEPDEGMEDAADEDPVIETERVEVGSWPPPEPILTARPSEGYAATWLERLEEFLEGELGSRTGWTARELCTLPKTPGRQVAIPPTVLWENMVPTLRIYQELRAELGVPFSIRGYRPLAYNRSPKVNGSRRSVHMWFAALDVYAPVSNRQDLARAAARYFDAHPDLDLGLGIYGHPWSSNIHIDTGLRRRTWSKTRTWLEDVRA